MRSSAICFGASILLSYLSVLSLPCAAVEPAVVVQKLTINYEVQPDGRYVKTYHREQIPKNQAAAARIGQFTIAFNPSLERLDIVEAYTLKADGTRKDVDASAVRSQLAPGVANVPIFRDIQQKVIIFPDLGPNDTEVIIFRMMVDHPIFPGQFYDAGEFSRALSWQDATVTITAPTSMPLQTESFDVPSERTEQDGFVHYVWHYVATEPVSDDLAVVSSWDRLPRFFVSSFPDYTALAAAYATLSDPKAAVTPTIQAKADEITAGLTSRYDQARAIYEWVSSHIRYVALYLAKGGLEPHSADTVLSVGYGDCKDHSVLFEALLKAKGIDSHPVLINLEDAYTLSKPPTLAQLNHVITWLPEFDVYADTTAAVAPFGTLPFREYGKPAIVVGVERKAVHRLPVLSPDTATIATRTSARLDSDGKISGETVMTGTGPAAHALRVLARNVQSMGQEAGARHQLESLGTPGKGAYHFAPPDGFDQSYRVTANFTLDPRPEYLEGSSFTLPTGPILLVRPGDYFLGPLRLPALSEKAPTPCFAGREIEDLSLTLPDDDKPSHLPADTHIEQDAFSYTSHWTLEGSVVSVHRELVSRVAEPLCTGTLRHEAAAALHAIRRDQRASIVLQTP